MAKKKLKLTKKQQRALRAKKAQTNAIQDIAKKSPAAAIALDMISGRRSMVRSQLSGHQFAPQSKARALDNYLFIADRLRAHTQIETDTTRQQQSSVLWAEVSHARLIEIRPELFVSLYHEADVFTTEKIVGVPWTDEPDGRDVSAEYAKKIVDAGSSLPFPEHLPFPAVFLSMREDIVLPHHQVMMRVPARFRASIPAHAEGRIIGYLLTEGPLAVEFYVIDNVKDNESLFLYEVIYTNPSFPGTEPSDYNRWGQSLLLHPWILNVLVSFINDHKTLVVEHPDSLFRKKWKQNRKLFSVKRRIPPPYYSIILRDKVVRDELEKTRKHAGQASFQYGHRFDVRRHERVRIMRGSLPLSDRLRKRLQKEPGRRIYTIEPLSADDAERLAKRGVQPKRRDEWMAILSTEISPHMKPKNEALPYIPATRKLPKRKLA